MSGDRKEIVRDITGLRSVTMDTTDAPVVKTETPARAANVTDADTVVTPTSRPVAWAWPRSRAAILAVAARTRSVSAPDATPTTPTPSITAVIAGTAPAARIAVSHRTSASRLAGCGSPKAL